MSIIDLHINKLEAELAAMKAQRDEALDKLTAIRAVCVGYGRDSKRGDVEDVADLKAQRDEAVRLLKSARSGLMTATEDDEMWNEQALSVCGRIDRLLSEVTP